MPSGRSVNCYQSLIYRFISLSFWFLHSNVCLSRRGMLTGKFKRGNAPLADSRIANADFSGRVLESSPSFDQYKDDENFWKIDDLLQKLATNYGILK